MCAALAVALALAFVLATAPAHGRPQSQRSRLGAQGRTTTPGRARVSRPPAQRQPAPVIRRRPELAHAEASIAPAGPTIGLNASFFGLSTEYWALPRYERHMSIFERVLALAHVPGDGPMILRVGGDSADHTYWDPGARTLPADSFRLTQGWLQRARTLVRSANLKLILDLNLAANSPTMAAQLARVALEELPPGSVLGFEIGNEPDLYGREHRPSSVRVTGTFTAADYVQEFRAYGRALRPVAPGIPLIGPSVADPLADLGWIARLIAGDRPALGVVSAHRYPLSACVARTSPEYPTIARLLSELAAADMARSLAPAVRLSDRAGLPFRLTELGSVTCGGLRGVSTSFATALWAPDALFELSRAGVEGVDVHIRADAVNAPFTLGDRGLTAHPLLYGLLLFVRTLGPDAQLLALRPRAAPSSHLKVWAVKVAGGALHVLLIDKGPRSVGVALRLPATAPATVQRLLAPSINASSGVTLAGQWLGRDGRWHGRRKLSTITRGPQGYELTMPGYSAALVSVQLPGGGVRLA